MKTHQRFLVLTTLLSAVFSPAFMQTPTPSPTQSADLHPSGWIDMMDLFVFSAGWGATTGPPRGDLNGNARCGPEDLLTLLGKWHTTSALPLETITIPISNLPPGARQMELVRIPAGTFEMGSPDSERGRYLDWEGPVHTVTLTNDFYIGETEVTQAQWKAIMGDSPADNLGVGNNYPVYFVSWSRANGFLSRLDAQSDYSGFRLPTEAEWEYACRAGTRTRFHYGDSLGCDDGCQNCVAGTLPGNRSDYMWYCWNWDTPYGAKPVGQLLPNAFGLYDMHGNVWEWCQDWFQEDYYSQPGATALNPLCTNSAYGCRVVRGGYWSHSADGCRSALRDRSYPTHSGYGIGVRVALPVSPQDR
jgi:formylglycine-generating enzyme required for sulfatase activity